MERMVTMSIIQRKKTKELLAFVNISFYTLGLLVLLPFKLYMT